MTPQSMTAWAWRTPTPRSWGAAARPDHPGEAGRNLASIVEVAAMNNRNRKMGHNAALELTRRMDQHFARKMGVGDE